MPEIAQDNEINLHIYSKSSFKALQKYVAFDELDYYLLYKQMDKIFISEKFINNFKSLLFSTMKEIN